MRLLHTAAKTRATFDDPNLVSHAGLVPVVRLAENVGLEELVAEHVPVAAKVGANPGLKIGSLVAGMVAGADTIDGMDVLRHGAFPATVGGIRAPSTLGSFLVRHEGAHPHHPGPARPTRPTISPRHAGVADRTLRHRPRRHPTSAVAALGVTNLRAEQAGPADIATLVQDHWGIESLHWLRDTVYHEDHSRARTRSGPRVMAGLRNLAIGALHLTGRRDITEATRWATRAMHRPFQIPGLI